MQTIKCVVGEQLEVDSIDEVIVIDALTNTIWESYQWVTEL